MKNLTLRALPILAATALACAPSDNTPVEAFSDESRTALSRVICGENILEARHAMNTTPSQTNPSLAEELMDVFNRVHCNCLEETVTLPDGTIISVRDAEDDMLQRMDELKPCDALKRTDDSVTKARAAELNINPESCNNSSEN